jgi:ATP-dependent helicase/DNAse subunit B
MTTDLIAAPPAAGKTTACIQCIQSLRARQPLAHIRVLVPDRLQAAAFRRRLADSGGTIGTHVETFGNLYRAVLDLAGVSIPVASPILLHRLIQDIVDRTVEAGQLSHFAPLQLMPGFVLALRTAFSELERSLIFPDHFLSFSTSGTPAQQELALLYARYHSALHTARWASAEGMSWLALDILKQQPTTLAAIDLLIVDGFDSLTAVQQQVLRTMSQQVRDLVITFPGEVGSTRPAHRRFTPRIDRLQQELSPTIIPLHTLPHLPPVIAHIESQLLEISSSENSTAQPILLEARSPAEEAREALRWIKRLVVRSGILLSQCALFTPDPAIYHPFLRAAAAEFGIPLRFTRSEPLDQSPAILALLNLLALPERNFNTRTLMHVLRSPYFALSIPVQTVDQLEQVSRVAQIVEGRAQWQETWNFLAPTIAVQHPDLDDERILPGLPRGTQAQALALSLDTFFDMITPPTQIASHTAWITWVEDLLERVLFFDKAGSERDQAACEVFRDTLRALILSESVAGERCVNYAQFLSDLRGALKGTGVREQILSGAPALLVGDMNDARGVRYQAVALLGLSEALFPANEHPDPFLDEDLRSALGMEPHLQREQAGLFYQAVTRTDRHLLITRPYLSEDGEKWEESTFWKAVRQLFDSSAVQTVRPDDPQPLCEAASTQELLFYAARRRSLPHPYQFLKDRWETLQHAGLVLQARRARHRSGPYEGFIDAAACAFDQRFTPHQIWSSSKLESYGSCSYQFFIQTALKLESPIEPKIGLAANQLGSMLHKILEITYQNTSDRTNLSDLLANLTAACQQVFSNAPVVYGFRPSPLWAYEKTQLLEKLQKTVTALAQDSRWTPVYFELMFGIGDQPPLEIDLGSETVRLRGVIDRVDCDDTGQLRVIDYKTGSSHLAPSDLKDGLRLQLPIYALAVRDALHKGDPVSGMYWNILAAEAGALKLESFKSGSAQGMAGAVDVVHQHLVRIVSGIRSAEFPPHAPQGCPSYCPGAQWCWHFEPSWHA